MPDQRQNALDLISWLGEQLAPNITSLVRGEPAPPMGTTQTNVPGAVKFTNVEDPRAIGSAAEAIDLLSNLVPLGGPAKAAGAVLPAVAARLARRAPQFTEEAVAAARAAAERAAGGHAPLVGLPQEPLSVGGAPFVPGPYGPARDVAAEYMKSAGLPYNPPKTYAPVDVERAKRIAQAFDEMKHDPHNPAVRASYEAMANETLAQYRAMQRAGIKIEFIKPGMEDPYKATPRGAQKDVIENKHLWVYPTDTGFGTDVANSAKTIAAQEAENPLLRQSGVEIDGHKLRYNDLFRVVHDFFGHIKEGHGFRATGEENAWRAHAAMYSDLARPAMTTETRGQNSWVNYGPHGEKNRTASAADTVYADQKVGLLPDWVSNEGRFDPATLNVGLNVPGGGSIKAGDVLDALKAAGVNVTGSSIRRSNTEPTLIANLDRALTPQEGDALSRALNQEAIAQHVPGVGGELYGPKAAEWGPFNPGAFLTPQGNPLSAPIPRRAAPGEQTVANPLRNFKPGIYQNAMEIVKQAAAQTAPESPNLKRLFGVTRGDLYDIAKSRGPGSAEPILQAPANPRGSAAATNVMTPENTGRILDALHLAERYAPQLTQPMDAWYVMDPYFQHLEQLVGRDAAIRLYNKQNAFTAMASPGSEVPVEINRGSAAAWLNEQGRFKDFEKYGGLPEDKRGKNFPADMRDIPGHPYHSTANISLMKPYAETGTIDIGAAKVPVYMQASGVPATGWRWDTPVGDAHWARAVGLPDVRTRTTQIGRSVTMPELTALSPWWRDQIAQPLGLLSVPAQARAWGVFAPQTGVTTAIGAPKLELWSDAIMRRARELGMESGSGPERLRDLILMLQQHAAAPAAGAFA